MYNLLYRAIANAIKLQHETHNLILGNKIDKVDKLN